MMPPERRAAAAVAVAAGLFSGCARVVRRYTTAPPPTSPVALPARGDIAAITRLLNRAAFGPRPGDVSHVAALGVPAYLDEQFANNDDEDQTLTLRLRGIDIVRDHSLELLRDTPDREVLRQLQQAALLRAVYGRHQLRERLVDFWTNHFNVYARKGAGTYLLAADQAVIRKHALGTFPDLLRASARSPAMLGYLDNDANRRGVPNENYARELMELHTLGVRGGYTQKDVQEVARALTGWTIESRFLKPRGTFHFDPSRHDNGEKTVLGHVMAASGGEQDGHLVLDLLASHPSTARFIAGKLCRYFLGESSPALAAWTEKLTALYAQTNGDLKTMLRPLLESKDLAAAPPVMKRPFDFVASALRATHADTDGGAAVQKYLATMGQPLHEWPLPDGYPDTTTAWAGSLLARWNFAGALLGGALDGTTSGDLPVLLAQTGTKTRGDALIALLLARRPGESDVRALAQALTTSAAASVLDAAALCLASPAFQWR